ncbi:hypothetical protein ACTU44_11960 [Thalassospira sp. SM2505]
MSYRSPDWLLRKLRHFDMERAKREPFYVFMDVRLRVLCFPGYKVLRDGRSNWPIGVGFRHVATIKPKGGQYERLVYQVIVEGAE